MADIQHYLAAHADTMVADLTEYVEHETPSDDPELLRTGFAWLHEFIDERIGQPRHRTVTNDDVHGPIGTHVYAPERGGTGRLLVLCHYDTVWPKGTLATWPVTVQGDRVSGPGCFDMKAGLIQFVWAVRAARHAGLPLPQITLLLTGDEEVGSPASRSVIEREAAAADAVLVFEASADGALKTARKGVGMFNVDVIGVEAHSGLDPDRGVSAIDELARMIRILHDAGDRRRGTTVNVGVVSGGSRSNVTAGHASAEVDVRVESAAEAQRIDTLLTSLMPHHPEAQIKVSGEWNRPPMERTEAIATLFELARQEALELGVPLAEVSVGGASDGNYAAAVGTPVLDGLGAVGDGAHARTEWISIEGLVERAALAARVMSRLADHTSRLS